MNKKRKGYIAIGIMLASLSLAGCSNQIPDMTDEQMQEVGEYAAVMLLKYDAHSRSRLIDLPEALLTSAGSSQPEPEQTGMDPVADTPVTEVGEETPSGGVQSLEGILGLPEGIALTYQDFTLCASYPEEDSDYFSLDAAEGKSLLVLKFQMANQASEPQEINMMSANIVYRITVNGNYTRSALTTLLLNDLSTYSGALEAGEQSEVVLILEVGQTTADQITSIALEVKKDSARFVESIL